MIEAFSQLNKNYPQDVFNLTTKELAFLRNIYFSVISAKGYDISEQPLIVDKGPHHTAALPLIVKLFPAAKLVATIRHPLDVCLSCFQQNFEFNQQNAFLVTLPDVVKRYTKVFTLLARYEDELAIKVKSIKYEDLVTNFDEVIQDLCTYLNFKPNAQYKNFHQHASKKYVSSASRGQTDKPLYQSSAYRWKNYQEQLSPYMAELQPFINKYGYGS